MANNKPLKFDNDVYDVMTEAVLALFAEYGEIIGQDIYFEQIGKDSGYAFQAAGGAEIITEKTTITGKVIQSCQYPIVFIRRTNSTTERQKLHVQTFLDTLGKWICKEEVKIDGEYHRLTEYPKLSHGRTITRVERYNSSGNDPDENGVQDWGLPLYIYYTHEFYKN